MRRQTSPEEWDHHVEAQPAGGKTVRAYCREHELDQSSFYRQRRKRSQDEPESQGFVRAPGLPERKPSGSSVSIRVRDLTLTLESGFSAEDLERVLLVLGKVQHVLRTE